VRKWFFQRFCAALGLLRKHITISAVFVNNPILRLLSFNHCWTPRAFLQVKRIFALRFFIVLFSCVCVSLLLVVPLQYRYGGALVPG
jgi:hypothetical protein